MNLLKETIECLSENEKTEKDVIWVGCKKFKSCWAHFTKIADIEYDDGYGGAEIAQDLLVVGSDFWLERHEYDGSEWWEFKQMPKEPEKVHNFKAVHGGCWDDLSEIIKKHDA